MLGFEETSWNAPRLADRIAANAGSERVSGAPPSHPLVDFSGQYENAADVEEFSEMTIEFVRKDGAVTALKKIDSSGELRFERRK